MVSENKEAVEAIARAIAECWGEQWECCCTAERGMDCDCGDAMTDEREKYDERLCRDDCRLAATAAIAAARPFIMEEAARIAERAHIDPAEDDDGNILRRTTNVAAAAAIRTAKETGE